MVFPSGTPAKLAVGFGREGLPGREVAASPQVAPGECQWTDIEGLRSFIRKHAKIGSPAPAQIPLCFLEWTVPARLGRTRRDPAGTRRPLIGHRHIFLAEKSSHSLR